MNVHSPDQIRPKLRMSRSVTVVPTENLLALLDGRPDVSHVDPVQQFLTDHPIAPSVLWQIENLGKMKDLGDR